MLHHSSPPLPPPPPPCCATASVITIATFALEILLVRRVHSVIETSDLVHPSCAELFESDFWASKNWMTHRATALTAECSLHGSFFPFLETRHGAVDYDAKVWRIYSAAGFHESDLNDLPKVPRPYCGCTGVVTGAMYAGTGKSQGGCAFTSLSPPSY